LKVELEKTFPMPAAPDVAWGLLQDVEAVAACMPGAKITQRIDDTHYKGTVTVRVGPATLSFRGDIEVRQVDGATRTLRLFGNGSDTTGSSAGSMDLTARIDAADGGLSALNGRSVVSLSGKAAAFGGRMVNSVADQILGQFAGNFAARLPAAQPAPSSTMPPSVSAAATDAPTPGAATSSPPLASPAPVPTEINGLALLWAICRDWLRGLFGRKRA
jgi:uncharacterized protein